MALRVLPAGGSRSALALRVPLTTRRRRASRSFTLLRSMGTRRSAPPPAELSVGAGDAVLCSPPVQSRVPGVRMSCCGPTQRAGSGQAAAAALCPARPPTADLPFLACCSPCASSRLLALDNNPLNLEAGSLAIIMPRRQTPPTGERSLGCRC